MVKKFKRSRRSDDGPLDRLSSLPDDILIHSILPLLPMRDVVRTSIFAPRWRSLWSYVPSLDLDGSHKVVPYPRIYGDKVALARFNELDQEAASKYAEWVDHVILAYRGSTPLQSFRIRFRLDSSFKDRIDRWLMFTFEKRVQALELNSYEFHKSRNPFYTFPVIQPRLCPNIRLLKSLTLKGLTLTNDSVANLLSVCEFLERLQLRCLYSLTAIKVTGPVSRLKSIDVRQCIDLESVEIYSPTPDLVSFQPGLQIINVHIEYAPRLVDLFIRLSKGIFNLSSHPLFGYISQLEALHLQVGGWGTANDRLPNLPDLICLKHLRLGLNYNLRAGTDRSHFGRQLQCLDSLIKALPSLQHLTLEVQQLDHRLKIGEEVPNLHLKLPRVIELVGFRGRQFDCELALHLIKAAVSLEKLIIDCREPSLRGGMYEYACLPRTVRKWRRTAIEKIKPGLPSKANLVLI